MKEFEKAVAEFEAAVRAEENVGMYRPQEVREIVQNFRRAKKKLLSYGTNNRYKPKS